MSRGGSEELEERPGETGSRASSKSRRVDVVFTLRPLRPLLPLCAGLGRRLGLPRPEPLTLLPPCWLHCIVQMPVPEPAASELPPLRGVPTCDRTLSNSLVRFSTSPSAAAAAPPVDDDLDSLEALGFPKAAKC